jgi:hypothetical protein
LASTTKRSLNKSNKPQLTTRKVTNSKSKNAPTRLTTTKIQSNKPQLTTRKVTNSKSKNAPTRLTTTKKQSITSRQTSKSTKAVKNSRNLIATQTNNQFIVDNNFLSEGFLQSDEYIFISNFYFPLIKLSFFVFNFHLKEITLVFESLKLNQIQLLKRVI